MFSDRWKPLTRADAAAGSRVAQLPSSQRNNQAPTRGLDPRGAAFTTRHSNGLDQFFGNIRGESGLNILDLAGASQANIGFITDLGHKLYTEDLLQSLDFAFGGEGDFLEHQAAPERLDPFLEQCLVFPENCFDGALVWDTLEFLAPPLLKAIVDRLHRILRRNAYLLAMFHADERAALIPTYSYRIADCRTLHLSARGMRRPAQFFNNRAVEKVFQQFDTVKFFLTRDALREVIAKR